MSTSHPLLQTSRPFYQPVLAIDTSAPWLTLGIAQQGQLRASLQQNCGVLANSSLIQQLDSLLAQCQLQPQDLKLLVTALGPGSFTGIRIGMATAFALAQVNRIPVVGVNNLKLLALHADPSTLGHFHSWRNCSREDLHHATWQWQLQGDFATLKEIEAPCLLPFSQAQKRIKKTAKKSEPVLLEQFPSGTVSISYPQPARSTKTTATLLLEAGIEQYLQNISSACPSQAEPLHSQFPQPLYLKNEAFRRWQP